MSFLALVLRNLVRQRVRTSLTVLGIGIGITTVVALGAITAGLRATMGDFTRAGGADFMVAQSGASDLSFSTVSRRDVERLAERPGVVRATPFLIEVAEIPGNPYFLLFGYEPSSLAAEQLTLLAGQLPAAAARDELLLSATAAKELDATVGSTVTLERHDFRVVGIYEAGDTMRDAGAIAPLPTVQDLASRPDVVTAVFVTVAAGASATAVAADVERLYPHLATIANANELGKVDQGMEIMDAVNLAISLLAVVIGGVGVMNTMIMSVFERTREFGILRAVGWRSSRVLRLVGAESLALCLVAAAVGTALGVAASRAVTVVPAVGSLLEPAYPPELFLRALAVGVGVALAGAAYPALRAARLSPMEALRHE